jgi:hypothetical protein
MFQVALTTHVRTYLTRLQAHICIHLQPHVCNAYMSTKHIHTDMNLDRQTGLGSIRVLLLS